MNVGIVGCGLIGQKRSKALAGARLVAVADAIPERAQLLAKQTGAETASSWESGRTPRC
ncbi:MAG: Gfo/Idh/MocA family oxidoreductase [Anaerolineae bacterium]